MTRNSRRSAEPGSSPGTPGDDLGRVTRVDGVRRCLGLGRLGVALFAGTCGVAIMLGRAACPGPVRVQGPAQFAVVPGFIAGASPVSRQIASADHGLSFLLDTDTGKLLEWRSHEHDHLSDAACSPWVDETGRSQVVAVWRGEKRAFPFAGVGIVRISCPDGAILDRVGLDVMPIGPCCWLPGTAARVVFAAGDGLLYRFAFEESHAPGGTSVDRCARPSPLVWRTDPPVRSRFYLREPSVPAHPRLASEMLVSVEICSEHDDGSHAPRELWRLQLDPLATSILAAGRLLEPSAPDGPGIERRFPVLTGQNDGSLVLAYLAGNALRGYQLRVAPARFDPRTGTPRAIAARERILAEGCLAIPPIFSVDGRSACCFPKSEGPVLRTLRLDVGSFPTAVEDAASDQDTTVRSTPAPATPLHPDSE